MKNRKNEEDNSSRLHKKRRLEQLALLAHTSLFLEEITDIKHILAEGPEKMARAWHHIAHSPTRAELLIEHWDRLQEAGMIFLSEEYVRILSTIPDKHVTEKWLAMYRAHHVHAGSPSYQWLLDLLEYGDRTNTVFYDALSNILSSEEFLEPLPLDEIFSLLLPIDHLPLTNSFLSIYAQEVEGREKEITRLDYQIALLWHKYQLTESMLEAHSDKSNCASLIQRILGPSIQEVLKNAAHRSIVTESMEAMITLAKDYVSIDSFYQNIHSIYDYFHPTNKKLSRVRKDAFQRYPILFSWFKPDLINTKWPPELHDAIEQGKSIKSALIESTRYYEEKSPAFLITYLANELLTLLDNRRFTDALELLKDLYDPKLVLQRAEVILKKPLLSLLMASAPDELICKMAETGALLTDSKTGFIALHVAINLGKINVLPSLIIGSDEIDRVNVDKETALDIACKTHNIDIIGYLLTYGLTLTEQNYKAAKTLAKKLKNSQVLTLLDDTKTAQTALFTAMQTAVDKNLDIMEVEAFLNSPGYAIGSPDLQGRSILSYMAELAVNDKDNPKIGQIIEKLLDAGAAPYFNHYDVFTSFSEIPDKASYPLYKLIKGEHYELIELFHRKKLYLKEDSRLAIAAELGMQEVVEWCLQKGDRIRANNDNVFKRALQAGKFTIVEYLLKQCGWPSDLLNNLYLWALQHQAPNHAFLSMLESKAISYDTVNKQTLMAKVSYAGLCYLEQKGAFTTHPIDAAINDQGDSLLMAAVTARNNEAARFLFERGADIFAFNKLGLSPMSQVEDSSEERTGSIKSLFLQSAAYKKHSDSRKHYRADLKQSHPIKALNFDGHYSLPQTKAVIFLEDPTTERLFNGVENPITLKKLAKYELWLQSHMSLMGMLGAGDIFTMQPKNHTRLFGVTSIEGMHPSKVGNANGFYNCKGSIYVETLKENSLSQEAQERKDAKTIGTIIHECGHRLVKLERPYTHQAKLAFQQLWQRIVSQIVAPYDTASKKNDAAPTLSELYEYIDYNGGTSPNTKRIQKKLADILSYKEADREEEFNVRLPQLVATYGINAVTDALGIEALHYMQNHIIPRHTEFLREQYAARILRNALGWDAVEFKQMDKAQKDTITSLITTWKTASGFSGHYEKLYQCYNRDFYNPTMQEDFRNAVEKKITDRFKEVRALSANTPDTPALHQYSEALKRLVKSEKKEEKAARLM